MLFSYVTSAEQRIDFVRPNDRTRTKLFLIIIVDLLAAPRETNPIFGVKFLISRLARSICIAQSGSRAALNAEVLGSTGELSWLHVRWAALVSDRVAREVGLR